MSIPERFQIDIEDPIPPAPASAPAAPSEQRRGRVRRFLWLVSSAFAPESPWAILLDAILLGTSLGFLLTRAPDTPLHLAAVATSLAVAVFGFLLISDITYYLIRAGRRPRR